MKSHEENVKSHRHGGIPHSCHNKCFSGSIAVRGIFVPESDEEIAAHPDPFPAEIKQEKIVPENQNQHESYEQIHIDEKPDESFFFPHELHGIKMNQRSEEHTSELQSRGHIVCRHLLDKNKYYNHYCIH